MPTAPVSPFGPCGPVAPVAPREPRFVAPEPRTEPRVRRDEGSRMGEMIRRSREGARVAALVRELVPEAPVGAAAGRSSLVPGAATTAA